MLTVSVMCIALGGFLILAGYLWLMAIEGRQRYHGKTTGVVAEITAGEPDTFGRQAGIHDYFYPIITYYAEGILHREKYAKGSNPCQYTVNEQVKIRYNERKPEEFEVDTGDRRAELARVMYYAGFACCCMGGIFFLIFATRG